MPKPLANDAPRRRRRGAGPALTDAPGGPMRLQKFLSDAGVASRRESEQFILDGRVQINGVVVAGLPAFVDPEADAVAVDGARVRVRAHEYFIINKPRGVVCTNRDPGGRTRAVDLVPAFAGRLFPVGRLDAESTGLLLLTNDGEMAQLMTHPRYGVPKTYRAEVKGRAPKELISQLRKGVFLSEGRATAAAVEIQHVGREESVLMITLREGRNRQVRRMLARLGYPVKSLKRVSIGPISVRGLPLGAARRLDRDELAALREALVEARDNPAPRASPRRTPRARAADGAAPPAQSEYTTKDAHEDRGRRPRGDSGEGPRRGAERSPRPKRDGRGTPPDRPDRGRRPERADRGRRPERSGRGGQGSGAERGRRRDGEGRGNRKAAGAAPRTTSPRPVPDGRPARKPTGRRVIGP